MTVRSIERLLTRVVWAICLVVIVRWLVIHKVDRALPGESFASKPEAPMTNLGVENHGSSR